MKTIKFRLTLDVEFDPQETPVEVLKGNLFQVIRDSVNNGKAQRIGLLNPNPLGLHDILGNVDEIVFDPFRIAAQAIEDRLQIGPV